MVRLIVARPKVVLRICHKAVCHWMTAPYVKVLLSIHLGALILSYHMFVLCLYLFSLSNRQSGLWISIKIKHYWIAIFFHIFTMQPAIIKVFFCQLMHKGILKITLTRIRKVSLWSPSSGSVIYELAKVTLFRTVQQTYTSKDLITISFVFPVVFIVKLDWIACVSLMWVVCSGEVRGEVGTRSRMCCVG